MMADNDIQSHLEAIKEYIAQVQNSGSDLTDIHIRKKQLQAIEKTIQQMQKAGISIPDEMRHLKSKLINDLSGTETAEATLQYINQEAIKLTKRLGFSISSTNANAGHTKRDHRPKTENAVLREYIIKALKHFDGRSRMQQVLDWMEEKLDGTLTPRDRSLRKGGEIVWRNNTQWERHKMIQEGILKSDSPHGVWELSEDYK